MGYVREYYADGHYEDRYSSFGTDTARDLARNAKPAAAIMNFAVKGMANTAESLAKKSMTEEEFAAHQAQYEANKKPVNPMMGMLRQTGVVGELIANTYELNDKFNADGKAIVKSLLHRNKKA